jgi:hypothetical protein
VVWAKTLNPTNACRRGVQSNVRLKHDVMRFTDEIMIKHMLLLFLLFSTSAAASDELGKVCFGKNLAKPHSEHTDRVYLRIDDSNKLYFNRPNDGPVLASLDINKNHMVKVYFDDQLVRSWPLNFSKLGSRSVIIWRSAGSWRMEPVEESKCK